MSEDQAIDLEDSKLDFHPSSDFQFPQKPDPMDPINDNLLNLNYSINLSFEPLKDYLASLSEAQKMSKIQLNEVVAENAKFKNMIKEIKEEYQEKFLLIETKIGDIQPDNMDEYEKIDRGFDDLGDQADQVRNNVQNTLANGQRVEEIQRVYDEAAKLYEQMRGTLKEYDTKAEGYIAISEYREELQKQQEEVEKIYQKRKDEEMQKLKHQQTEKIIDLNTVDGNPEENLLLTEDQENGENKTDNGVKPERLFTSSKNTIEIKQPEDETPHLQPETNFEEYKREHMRLQSARNQTRLEELKQQLEELKKLQAQVKEQEKNKKPKLTYEMIRQIGNSYTSSIMLKDRLNSYEDEIAAKIQEINTKLGNKTDIIEFEAEMLRIKEDIEKLSKVKPKTTVIRNNSTSRVNNDSYRPNIGIVQEKPGIDPAIRKLIERHVAEINNTFQQKEQSVEKLKEEYSRQSAELKLVIENLKGLATNEQFKILNKQIIILNDRIDNIRGSPPIIPFQSTEPDSDTKSDKKSSKIVINNADKIHTEKHFRDIEREIEKLRKETFTRFDATDNAFSDFKKSINKILERQDQSIISILTRVTCLEVRVDSLELDGKATKTIDTKLLGSKSNRNKAEMLEALQIAEKLLGDFKVMREEVYGKLYEIQENGLNK